MMIKFGVPVVAVMVALDGVRVCGVVRVNVPMLVAIVSPDSVAVSGAVTVGVPIVVVIVLAEGVTVSGAVTMGVPIVVVIVLAEGVSNSGVVTIGVPKLVAITAELGVTNIVVVAVKITGNCHGRTLVAALGRPTVVVIVAPDGVIVIGWLTKGVPPVAARVALDGLITAATNGAPAAVAMFAAPGCTFRNVTTLPDCVTELI